jgi:hypothetical protein
LRILVQQAQNLAAALPATTGRDAAYADAQVADAYAVHEPSPMRPHGKTPQDANLVTQSDEDPIRAPETLCVDADERKSASDRLALRWRRWWHRVMGG